MSARLILALVVYLRVFPMVFFPLLTLTSNELVSLKRAGYQKKVWNKEPIWKHLEGHQDLCGLGELCLWCFDSVLHGTVIRKVGKYPDETAVL